MLPCCWPCANTHLKLDAHLAAAATKARCEEAEADRAEQDAELSRIAEQASAALAEKRAALAEKRAAKKTIQQKQLNQVSEGQAKSFNRKKATRTASAEDLDAVERALARNDGSDSSAPPSPEKAPGLRRFIFFFESLGSNC